jgi:ADP-ribose pyrophosphatase YjhB (NUDIX family)
MDTDERKIERQGKIAALVVPRRMRADGTVEYMVQKRLKQPFYGFYGFMTGKIRWGEAVAEGAARELKEETGLEAQLVLKGTYHKRDYTPEGKLLEDKHFYIMLADDPSGDFMATFEGGENTWYSREEILALERAFARMDIALNAVAQEGMVFAEESFTYGPDEY